MIQLPESEEWFDNHKIETILACKRKAFWHLIGPPSMGKTGPGLSAQVGSGADFGTACHSALWAYRNTWQKLDELDRQIAGFKAFEKDWRKLFPNGPYDREGRLESNHRLERGIQITQAYFERFQHQQALYRPVDFELGFAIRVVSSKNEPFFQPFWFLGRIDGIDERLSVGDWVVNELKTTSSGATRRLKSLQRSRQAKGYVWAVREVLAHKGMDPSKVTGFLGDVILVAAQKCDFQRDYFPVSMNETEDWRRQTINIVQEWRQRLYKYREERGSIFPDWRSLFYENTEECHKYGQCPYWDLCQFGPSPANLADFTLDTWNPLNEKPEKQLVIANG